MKDWLPLAVSLVAVGISAGVFVRDWLRYRRTLDVHCQFFVGFEGGDGPNHDWVIIRISNPSARPNSILDFGFIDEDHDEHAIGAFHELMEPILAGHILQIQLPHQSWTLVSIACNHRVRGFFVDDLDGNRYRGLFRPEFGFGPPE